MITTRRKNMNIAIGSGLITFAFLFTVMAGLFIVQYEKKKKLNIVQTELQINNLIRNMAIDGQMEKIYLFYDRYTKNREITILIVNNALSNNIPINIFFGIAYCESRFIPEAVGKKNNDGSKDYGLFQLNSNVYSKYEKKYLMRPVNNIRLAASHLLNNYEKYNNWYEGIMAYNGGNTREVPNRVIKYMVNVYRYAEKIDIEFYKYIKNIKK
jgi:hypothetical protein